MSCTKLLAPCCWGVPSWHQATEFTGQFSFCHIPHHFGIDMKKWLKSFDPQLCLCEFHPSSLVSLHEFCIEDYWTWWIPCITSNAIWQTGELAAIVQDMYFLAFLLFVLKYFLFREQSLESNCSSPQLHALWQWFVLYISWKYLQDL